MRNPDRTVTCRYCGGDFELQTSGMLQCLGCGRAVDPFDVY